MTKMLGTWVTEKFGQKIGRNNCLLVILLIMVSFILAKYPITPTLYVTFKPVGYILYA